MSNYIAGECDICGGVVAWIDFGEGYYICSDCLKRSDGDQIPGWIRND